MLLKGFLALVRLCVLLLQGPSIEPLHDGALPLWRDNVLLPEHWACAALRGHLRHHYILLRGRLLAEHRRSCFSLLRCHFWRRNRSIISVNLLPLVLLYSRRLLRWCVRRGNGAAADCSSRPTFFLILTISLDRIQLFLFDRHNLPPLIQAIRPGHSQSG